MSETTITPDEKTEPTTPAADGQTGPAEPSADGQTGTAEPASKQERSKAPDTSKITADAINSAVLAIPAVVRASQPTRTRKPEQLAMDKVAIKAYAAWVKAGKPTAWDKTPLVTYFLADDAEVKAYRYLIAHACQIVPPQGEINGKPVTGVRARFGTVFTLSEEQANDPKVNRPNDVGKLVLAWAAIDKRTTEATSETKTDASKPKSRAKK